MQRLKIFNPDGLTGPAARRQPLRLVRGGAGRWLHAAIVDLVAIVAIGLSCGLALGQSPAADNCYTDPITGKQYCTLPKSTLPPSPILRLTVVDRETPFSAARLGPGEIPTGMQDSGTCTLIFDDGQRAIVLSCCHNFRNTSPPYSVKLAGQWRAGRLIATDPENDLAALEIAGGTGITPMPIDDGPLPAEVCGAGYGGADDGHQFKQVCGAVTSTAWQNGVRGFTGQVRQGDSGGPVLTREGRLVGVLTASSIEYHEVIFCCDQPLRRFLDRVLPGRPARIIPHYQGPPRQPYAQPTPFPNTTPAARPPVPVTTGPRPAPAGNNNSTFVSTPQAYAPTQSKPALPPELPAARVENPPATSPPVAAQAPVTYLPPPAATQPPAVPPLDVMPPSTPPINPTSPNTPPWPSDFAENKASGLATSLIAKGLVYVGLPLGGAAIAAPLVYWFAKRRIKKKLHPVTDSAWPAGGPGGPPPPSRFR